MDDSDSDNWEEVVDMNDISPNTNVPCLFCPQVFGTAWQIFQHCAVYHNFDIATVIRSLSLDCYGYIKMINYIRRKKPSAERILLDLNHASLWTDDYYMIPSICDDPLLMVDVDTIIQSATKPQTCVHSQIVTMNPNQSKVTFSPPQTITSIDSTTLCERHAGGNTENKHRLVYQRDTLPSSCVTPTPHDSVTHVYMKTETSQPCKPVTENSRIITAEIYNSLLAKHQQSEANLKIVENEMNRCLVDLNRMKQMYRNLMTCQPSDQTKAIRDIPPDVDDAYFSSYAHFSIHQEMLQDKIRTDAYRDLFENNPDIFKDKSVLDIGCGTGILSLFAACVGATPVTGIDQSDIVYNAIDIVRENDMSDKITIIKGRLEDTVLPLDKYDLIVSEWMGYFLLYEAMLDTVLFARDKYLKPTGTVFPDRCSMSILGIDDQESRKTSVDFWDDVYGFKMTCMKGQVSKEASVMVVSPESVVTQPCLVKNLDIMTCSVADLQFTSSFLLAVQRDASLTALVGYFDAFFERGLGAPITITTSPSGEETHWKQTVFYLPSPRSVKKGELVTGSLSLRKTLKDPRSLSTEIKLFDETYTYMLP